jgi:hypothetical protein
MDKLLLHKLYCGTELKWTVLTCIDHVLCCIFSVLEGFLHLDGCIPADVDSFHFCFSMFPAFSYLYPSGCAGSYHFGGA